MLAAITGLLVAIAAGTAIAIAAVGSGPVPPPKPLAQAVHQALTAPAVAGISARVTFTNHLIDTGEIQGADPLLSGASGRLWLSPGHGLRLELQSDSGDAQVLVTGNRFWAYDPMSNTVYRGTLPAGSSKPGPSHDQAAAVPTLAQIQAALQQLAGRVSLSGAKPGDIAGRPTYTLRVTPRVGGGLLGGAEMTWDTVRGVPLRFAIYARGDSTPVLALSATSISYGSVPASVFKLRPPSGTKVVTVDLPVGAPAGPGTRRHGAGGGRPAAPAHLNFRLDAPATAGGLRRTAVTEHGTGAHSIAVVTYGAGPGAVSVIERAATGTAPRAPGSAIGEGPGLTLPSVSIRGASAQELDTALGSVLQFRRGGIDYTVLGSVKPAVARAVAGAL